MPTRTIEFVGLCFFFQAEDGIRDLTVTGVQTCALPISRTARESPCHRNPAVAISKCWRSQILCPRARSSPSRIANAIRARDLLPDKVPDQRKMQAAAPATALFHQAAIVEAHHAAASRHEPKFPAVLSR